MSQSRSSFRSTQRATQGEADSAVSQVVVPAGAPTWVTEELIALTLKTWQPFYSQQLIESDALEMIMGVDQLFGVVSRDKQDEAIRSTGEGQ